MKILLDENVTPLLGKSLRGHECVHVSKLGWSGRKNGHLLTSAEDEGFHVLLTLDKSIPYQQSFKGRGLTVVVLRPKSQGVSAILRLVPALLDKLIDVTPGSHFLVEEP